MTLPRAAVREIVINAVKGLIGEDRIFAAGHTDTPQGYEPFIVIKWNENVREFGVTSKPTFDLWIYDRQETYSRIDKLSDLCRIALTSVEHYTGSDGVSVTQIDWEADSPDFYDDVFNAQMRRASFKLPHSYTR